ncbi:MAG: cytochrome c [Desulfobulbaceae bacterium]|nr:cytochrome c [Desulfobulbaceae bacterium]
MMTLTIGIRGWACIMLAAGCFFLLSAGCSRVPEGNVEDGERWYKLHRCNGCHGEDGTGGRGPVLAGTPLSFNRFLHKVRSPDSAIMPAYGNDRLPDKDAGEIYLWLLQQNKE